MPACVTFSCILRETGFFLIFSINSKKRQRAGQHATHTNEKKTEPGFLHNTKEEKRWKDDHHQEEHLFLANLKNPIKKKIPASEHADPQHENKNQYPPIGEKMKREHAHARPHSHEYCRAVFDDVIHSE